MPSLPTPPPTAAAAPHGQARRWPLATLAAGVLLVKEAGGMVEGLRKGQDPLDGALIAGNEGLFDAFAGTLRG